MAVASREAHHANRDALAHLEHVGAFLLPPITPLLDVRFEVEEDEQGTLAAAATGAGVSLALAGSGVPAVVIDRPFLVLVRDTSTGSLLFMGHVEDPRASP